MASAPTSEKRDALLALLDWYVESGVDLALDDVPHDRYADSARTPLPDAAMASREPPASSTAAVPRPRPAPAIAVPDEAARVAETAAARAGGLDELAAVLADFPHAPFRDMARHFLLGAGAPGASLMILDAAPGAVEETTGEAFSGLQARLLDNMLAAVGRSRNDAYLAYVAPWRPPGDRALTPPEIAIFAPFVRRHVELARPEILLLFGEAPTRSLLEANEPLSKLRGKAFDVRCGGHGARAFVFSSLDAMLKSAALKPAAWRDLRTAASSLSSLAGRGLG